MLESAERKTHNVLRRAPQAITTGQIGVYQLRQDYAQLSPKLQQIQQFLAILNLGRSLLGRRSLVKRPPRLPSISSLNSPKKRQ